ncbi:MAG: TIGR02281 family clan AA aspartic protease [Deltaproteobacteria bacterium]|nr:TIGR02281 family clan AA aspartic protease [Deltaproteobacteria bacterium]MBW2362684.1 TIGR02281 family clan AA aspartic protease [Deltaproteobacteria bacterium]
MRPVVVLLALALCGAPAGAEIYRWSDANGQVHFTQDLSQVPPAHRRSAEGAARSAASESNSRVQTYSGGAARAAPPRRAAADSAAGQVHTIRVARAGTGMMVNVRLNGKVTAPFLIDTGASDVLLPQAVADRLGLDTGPGRRTKRYSTANGIVEHPTVMLDSVSVGGATVKGVPASVSDSMSVGLLGLSFFNHFTYNIDAANGVVTLQRNALASSGQILGGRSAAQWQAEYANLGARIERVAGEYERKAESKARARRELEAERARLDQQLDQLEEEADRAHVPMAWRR